MKQIIEAEGGEYYLGKNQEGMIRGKSHSQGGVDMLAETNDFIFPKKYAKIAQTLREEMMGYQKEIDRYSKSSKKYSNKDVVESGMQRLQQRNTIGIEAAAAKLKELMMITALEKQQKEANKYAKGSFIDPPKAGIFPYFTDPIARPFEMYNGKHIFYSPVPTIPGSPQERNFGPYLGVRDSNNPLDEMPPTIYPNISPNYRAGMRNYIDAVEGITSGDINPDGAFGLPENLRGLDFVRSSINNRGINSETPNKPPTNFANTPKLTFSLGDPLEIAQRNKILFRGLPKTKKFNREDVFINTPNDSPLNNITTPKTTGNYNFLEASPILFKGAPELQKFNRNDFSINSVNPSSTIPNYEPIETLELKSQGIKQINNPSPEVKPSDLTYLEKNFTKKLPEDENGNPPMFSYGDAAILAGGIPSTLYNFIMGSKPAEEYSLGRVNRINPALVSDAAALRDQRTALSSILAGAKRSRLSPAQRQALLSGLSATGLKGMQDTSLAFANQNAGIINQARAQNAQIDFQNIGLQDKENQINMANRAARANFTTKGFENLNSMLVNAGQGLNKKQQGMDLYEIFMKNPDYFRPVFENGKLVDIKYIGNEEKKGK